MLYTHLSNERRKDRNTRHSCIIKRLTQRTIVAGQIGTVVESYSDTDFEVESSDNKGKTISILTFNTNNIMLLRNEPVHI